MANNNVKTQTELCVLRDYLYMGSGFSGSHERIKYMYADEKDRQKRIDFLKNEYGVGGGSHDLSDGRHISYDYDAKGISIDMNHTGKILFSWNEVNKELESITESENYCRTLFNIKKGIVVLPAQTVPFSITKNETFNKVVTLYPNVLNILKKNCFEYSPETLLGKVQRISLTDDLQAGIIYCIDKDGDFLPDKYIHGIQVLTEKYPDMKVHAMLDTKHIYLNEEYNILGTDYDKSLGYSIAKLVGVLTDEHTNLVLTQTFNGFPVDARTWLRQYEGREDMER